MPRRYWDITLPFSPALPAWPGEPKPVISKLSDIGKGQDANVTRIDTCVHFGTHLDAPSHFIDGGAGVDSLDPDTLIGKVYVAHFPDCTAIDAAALEGASIPADCRRLLLRTRNSDLWDNPDHEFFQDYVAVSSDGAQWLVSRGIELVGIDYLSIEQYTATDFSTHLILLGASVIVVEGLDLREVPSGLFEMACLPMKIVDADGAPTRVILWRDT